LKGEDRGFGRNREARIMVRNVVDCLAPGGVLEVDEISSEQKNNILEYCGYGFSESERFFVRAKIEGLGGTEIGGFIHGDSGLEWVRSVFEGGKVAEEVKKYNPGYFLGSYEALLNGNLVKLNVEVVVGDEF